MQIIECVDYSLSSFMSLSRGDVLAVAVEKRWLCWLDSSAGLSEHDDADGIENDDAADVGGVDIEDAATPK